MKKLTLEHLAGYLPYDLLLWWPEKLPFSEFFDTKKEAHSLKMGVVSMVSCIKGNCKPILRPLSDLTKEIEVGGEKFVPHEQLYNISETEVEREFFEILEETIPYILEKIQFAPYCVVKSLYSWHFDIHNLISEGLAIDINTI